jgi:hypothetical protein
LREISLAKNYSISTVWLKEHQGSTFGIPLSRIMTAQDSKMELGSLPKAGTRTEETLGSNLDANLVECTSASRE